jgi:hypothetical protein
MAQKGLMGQGTGAHTNLQLHVVIDKHHDAGQEELATQQHQLPVHELRLVVLVDLLVPDRHGRGSRSGR